MNKLLTIISAFAFVVNASAAEKTVTVKVTNPGDARKAVPVVLKLNSGKVKITASVKGKASTLPVMSALVTLNGKEIPCQMDDLNDDGLYEELSFVTDMTKGEKQTFKVTLSDQGAPKKYPEICYGALAIRDRGAKDVKTSIKNQVPLTSLTFPKTSNPYQHVYPHGAVMESDMVGFRAYCDHRQTIDYYGHRQLKADVKETAFYADSVQQANGSGEDVLWTGSTYGCGTLMGWNPEKNWLVMFENVRNTTMDVVAYGPVRTVLRITNRAWQPLTTFKPVDVVTTYILYAHHRDVQVNVKFSHNVNGLPLSTGTVDIADHNGAEQFTDKAGLRACWGTAWGGNNIKVYNKHTVGLAVCVPEKNYKGETHFGDMSQEKIGLLDSKNKPQLPNQGNAVLVNVPGNEINYNFAATCDLESFGFKSSKEWFQWLKDWKIELSKPAQITVE